MFAEFLLFFATTFFVLLFGHCVADFALQNSATARAKSPLYNPPCIWGIYLFGHAMIHAGFVFLFTGMLVLAVLQLVSHALIDWLQCTERLGPSPIGFFRDQMLHTAVLFVTALIYCLT